MKGRISVLALTVVLILGLGAATALAGNSFNFLGETTWTVTINERETGPVTPQTFTMTGAISKLGPNYYLFQGRVQVQGDGPSLMAGSGTLIGDMNTSTLYLTLSSSQNHLDSQSDSNRDTGVVHIELNPTTLSGTFYEVGHDFDRVSHKFSERFTAGNVDRNPGPPYPLSPSATAPMQLLLQN